MIKYIKGSELEGLLPKEGPSVVNVFATWCGPCKMLQPTLEEISEEVPVFKIDADADGDFVKSMGVSGLPATFVFKDGKQVDFLSGFVPKQVITSKF